ncbi:protease modulator HflC [Lentisalinibacter orientalis]|jgi:membrane protease subunit HflC|uniref:protease modulator HflC n=1 Tax=Lentisalinibacter orientalis TaxID=2992241 RepID=UPI00386D490F
MSNARFIVVIVLGLALVILGLSVFTVDEREYALKFRFGEVIASDYEPGLHFKMPIVNNVRKFPRQILTLNNPPEEVITAEKKSVFVDFFVKWRIRDARQYYVSTGGNEVIATGRLLEILKADLRNEFAKRTVRQVVSLERTVLMDDIVVAAAETATEFGIELVDVRVKRIEFSEDVAESVYRRMRQERATVATELRAEGAEEAERMRADADRQRTILIAEANREAQQIRGEGDAISAEVYARAFDRDREFYAFYRSIQAYRNSIGLTGDLLVLDPDGDFFRYLNDAGGAQR